MATANMRFSSNVSYDVVKVDVKVGEKFSAELVDQEPPTEWYSKADEVLNIKQAEDGNSAQIEATAVGSSKIRIFDESDAKVLELEINVLDAIEDPAVDLGLKVGEPELKERKK